MREVVPTVEQAGIDEGYLDLGEVAPAFDDARALAEAVRAVVGRERGSRARSASRPRRSWRRSPPTGASPAGSPSSGPGARRRSSRRSRSGCCRGSARAPSERLTAAGIETIGELAALEDAELAGLLPGKVGRLVRDRARGIDPRAARGLDRADLDLERGDLRAGRRRCRAAARRAAPDGRPASPRTCASTSRPPAPSTTKLRYPDFSIRTRSTSLEAGTDDADRIGELACALLDRALRDRPGPLRLVGVGLSGLDRARAARARALRRVL